MSPHPTRCANKQEVLNDCVFHHPMSFTTIGVRERVDDQSISAGMRQYELFGESEMLSSSS